MDALVWWNVFVDALLTVRYSSNSRCCHWQRGAGRKRALAILDFQRLVRLRNKGIPLCHCGAACAAILFAEMLLQACNCFNEGSPLMVISKSCQVPWQYVHGNM